MTNEGLNLELYRKLSAEMEQFKEELLSMQPEEMLENAYDYATRQDFLLCLQERDLTDKQCIALLKSKHPLQDAIMKWEHSERPYMESIWETIQSCANAGIREDFRREMRARNDEAR